MEPLKITVHLMSGFCANDPYSPAIDGIIGYAFMLQKIGRDQINLDQAHYDAQAPLEGLPLQVERFDDDWWYQCSLPLYHDQAVFNRYIHRRFDALSAESLAPNCKKIETTKGPYKNARILLQQHITQRIEWQVVGIKDEIEPLLELITHIGKRKSSGFGRIRRWEIVAAEDDSAARFYRPLPQAFAEHHQITGALMRWGIRPPAKITVNQRICIMPYAG